MLAEDALLLVIVTRTVFVNALISLPPNESLSVLDWRVVGRSFVPVITTHLHHFMNRPVTGSSARPQICAVDKSAFPTHDSQR